MDIDITSEKEYKECGDDMEEILAEYEKCVGDMVSHDKVLSMDTFIQHGNVTCFEHCITVSYYSYRICRRLGLDYRSAARGALLHDFFLYDWHTEKTEDGLHGFTHPHTALMNAKCHFKLNEVEEDIIVKHMWPLTLNVPKFRESFVVTMVDKICAIMEAVKFVNIKAGMSAVRGRIRPEIA
jgi:uncharacterized protein